MPQKKSSQQISAAAVIKFQWLTDDSNDFNNMCKQVQHREVELHGNQQHIVKSVAIHY